MKTKTKPTQSQEASHQSTQAQQPRSEQPSLVQRYGKIGIPALKAVLRYATPARNLVTAPSALRFDDRFVERAA